MEKAAREDAIRRAKQEAIKHNELADERFADLCTAGKSLFKRAIIKERFGEKDAVEFLQEVHQQKELLRTARWCSVLG